MRILGPCLVMLVATADARTVARTAKSEVVNDLQVELAVWDASYGRGPIKMKLTFTNRGKAPLKFRLAKTAVTLDITECGGVQQRAYEGGASGVSTLAPGKSVTMTQTVDLHVGTAKLALRYELAEAGVWSGKLATAPVEITVKSGAKCPTAS